MEDLRMKPAARTSWTLWACLSVFLLATLAAGQQRDEYGEIRQTVARISYLSGEVSFSRGDDPDDWQPADRNVPMTLGDRIYTGNSSRMELQIHGGNSIRLGAHSDLAALNLTDDTKQFSIRAGIASFQIRRLFENELFEVDTPVAAVTFDRPGDYRVDVEESGRTRLSVRQGSATVAAGGGQIPVNEGEAIELEGLDAPRYDIVSLLRPDGWDQWVGEREGRLEHSHSLQYMSADIVGADDLDEHGRWEDVPQYGRCWSPTVVAVDWAPYRVGHWIWQDPWGWTWVSAEPWGWAPYHYGRWVVVSSRWYWVPVAPQQRFVAYSPALVAFVGGGPGWSASVTVASGGVVGWFPLGPRDPFLPWWGLRAHTRVSTVSNVTYVNRTFVTVVNHNTFVSGGIVTNSWVRDRAVVNQVVAAPVLRGPVPIVPTAASLRMAVRTDAVAAVRPPAAILTRQVVARSAPPPAPPTFRAKLAVITQDQGAPVAPAVAARISVENRGRPQSVTTVRPAAEAGQIQLAPRGGSTENRGGPKPEPVTAFRGRPMATTQQPVATSPVTGFSPPSSSGPPPREIAPRPERQVVPPTPVPGRVLGQQGETAPTNQRQIPPTPVPGRPPGQPGGSGVPGTDDSRGRVRPTAVPPANQPSTIERRQVGAPPATPAPETSIERRRVQPTPPPAPKPTSIERRQERPTVAPPESQPQGYQRGRERPTAPPAEHPPAEVQRGRERPTSPPVQNAAPPSEKRKDVGQPSSPPPTAPPHAQGGEREQPKPQPQRGRPTPKPEPTKKPE
jgi:hypothetical protein